MRGGLSGCMFAPLWQGMPTMLFFIPCAVYDELISDGNGGNKVGNVGRAAVCGE